VLYINLYRSVLCMNSVSRICRCIKRVYDIELLFSLRVVVHYYLLIVEVKSTGVPVKGNHVEGLCQLSLKMTTTVKSKWVACLIQKCVIVKVL
jgi:hypothetical protein